MTMLVWVDPLSPYVSSAFKHSSYHFSSASVSLYHSKGLSWGEQNLTQSLL